MKRILGLICVTFFFLGFPWDELRADAGATSRWTPEKMTAAGWVDANSAMLTGASRHIWELAELALREYESSKFLSNLLSEAGFELEFGISGMSTAFVASSGSGGPGGPSGPVVAFLAEFDALPGLSQAVSAVMEPLIPDAGGHGCGHNLFGVGSVGAAIALKEAMIVHGLSGTVRLYGTPAEEQGIGKVFMVRDGLFDDVDICLSWHPSDENKVRLQPSKALRSFEVTFYGRSAHASGAPWEGVSALDAVEAFETGVNLLREHMPETARIHYVVTDGGGAPNVIPARAGIWVFTRGKDWPEEEKVYAHVRRIIEAADMMAWGEEYGTPEGGFRPSEVTMFTGLYDYNINLTAGEVVQGNLELVGAPDFTREEQQFARELQRGFGLEPTGMNTEITPFDPDRAPEPGGSTDVANISWVSPTVGFNVANWPIGIPAHSWASASASGSSAGYKAMLAAAKILALSGIDVLSEREVLDTIRAEFKESLKRFNYEPPIGPDVHPALPSHMK